MLAADRGAGSSAGQFRHDFFRAAQVLLGHDPWFAVHACRLDQVVVRPPIRAAFLDHRGHMWVLHHSGRNCCCAATTRRKITLSRKLRLVHQEIWAWLIVHDALAALITRAATAADLDPDRISFTRALRLVRPTGTANIPLSGLG